ncbi:uncharacterized protein [Emydura macquarii macquarii]|uniref:uncharacterized protein n=1 Tax=Emydura macquarii macquarii TaxID=1129001 RepID=UPI00352A6011
MAAAEGQFQAITKATVSITDADKVRKEAELLLKPEAKWEELLMPAAISVAILGELACNSVRHKDDVSINKNCPTDAFKSIERPGSFRACLDQVNMQAWGAFNEVYQIDTRSRYVSGKLTDIMQSFFQNAQVGKNQLLRVKQKIQDEAEKCRKSAQEMKDKFLEVILLVKELSQACQNASHGYEKDLNDVKMALDQAKNQGKSVSKAMGEARQKQMQAEGEMKEAFKEFWEAVNFSPTSWYDGGSDVSNKIELLKKQLSKVEGETLRQSHKEDKRSFENIIKLIKEMQNILCEIKENEMKEKDLETARKMLIEGQGALEKVEQQWEKMVQFFQVISNLIEFCFNWHIQECSASAEGVQQITHAFNASSVAQLVNLLFETYNQVRENYMKILASSSRILTKELSDPSFDSECAEIKIGCTKAKTATSELLLERKDEFKKNFNARLETIEKMKAMQHP